MERLVYLLLCVMSSAQEITQLDVPLYADPRRAAELDCHFDMHRQTLHSVKWYRDMDEIFRYNPSQKTQIRLFNVTGLTVESGECSGTACSVQVMPPPAFGQASYTCEVSSEGPMFTIAKMTKHMSVVAMPEKDPVITNVPRLVKPGELMMINCSSDYSLPPADVNWYIDDELQKPEPWERREVSAPVTGGLRASWRILRVKIPHTASGALRVRCEAVLPVVPPVVRNAFTIVTVHSVTQISKYVANCGATRDLEFSSAFVAVLVLCRRINLRFHL